MKKESPRSEKRGPGLADGLNDSGARCGMPTTGRDQGKAQSERAKRGLRHIDPGVASRARSSGTGSRHRMSQRRRLGSGPARSLEAWDQPGQLGGAGRPMPSARALSSLQNLSQHLQSLIGEVGK